MSTPVPVGLPARFVPGLLGLGTLALGAAAVASLRWRMVHDTPMMLYQAFCIERFGWLPYRDFFDMNLPVTYAIYRLMGTVFGYGDFGALLADLSVLACVLAVTVALFAPMGWRAAWAGALLFGLSYLLLGPWQAL